MKQGIIFDMDGTLWDSADGVAKSWTQVIQNEYKKDMAVTEQDIKRVMGKTMDVIGDIFFPELTSADHCIVFILSFVAAVIVSFV